MATSHYNTIQYLDYSGERSSMTVYNGSVTALTITDYLAQLGTLKNTTDAITLGVRSGASWVGDKDTLDPTPPTNVFAQREIKWLVRYKNVVSNKVYTLEIPTADPTGRLLPQSDKADLANAEIAAWVTAFEDIGRSPENDVDGVEVIEIVLVGRNL